MGKARLLAAFLFLTAVGVSSIQAQSTAAAMAHAPNSDPFAASHAELERAADNALTAAVQRMADAASDDSRTTRQRSPESLLLDFDQRYRPTAKLGLSAAMKRLDQLRPVVEPILQSEGIPVELASVVVVESGGRPNALSPKGALGLWQLMPDTGRRYGLVVDSLRDDRLDVEKSTRAAARYLSDLYEQFGSWPLALAAYNAGEQVLQQAVNRGGSSNFLQLSDLRLLPQETRNYVPEVLSVMRLHGSQQLPEGATATRSSDSSERVFAVPRIRP